MYSGRRLNRIGCTLAAARYLAVVLVGASSVWPAFAEPGGFPHWDEEACGACHGEGTPASIESYDDDAMCGSCHEKSDTVSCRHPSGLALGSSGSVSLPDGYRSSTQDGKLVCTTCHDPLIQCQGDKLAPYLNPRFLRGGPFRQADDACLLCHDTASYSKLNPHVQLTGGKIRQATCGFCHNVAAGEVSASSGFRIDASIQCLSCHAVSPHPMSMIPGSGIDSWNHLVVPGESTMRRMSMTRERTGARLPVAPGTGKITCATCHDPHEAGVIAGDPPFLDRARLRPAARCEDCHEK